MPEETIAPEVETTPEVEEDNVAEVGEVEKSKGVFQTEGFGTYNH